MKGIIRRFLTLAACSLFLSTMATGAELVVAGPNCGRLCFDILWVGDQALLQARDENGEVVKTEAVSIPRGAKPVSPTFEGKTKMGSVSALNGYSEGPGAPNSGNGSVATTQTYETATQLVTVTMTFTYNAYRLVSVTTSTSVINKKDIDDPETKPK